MVKDPHRPRGRTTAYAYFVIEEKNRHQQENPGAKIVFGDFSKECGRKWQTMNEADRQPFDEMAAQDKLRYDNEMANYVPPPGTKKKPMKRKNDPNAPKRPLTAFFIFSSQHRERVKGELGEDAKVGDIAKRLGVDWNELGQEGKAQYVQEAQIRKQEYEKAMEEYRQNGAKQRRYDQNEEELEEEDEEY
jgi:hypothetical protein